jgi:hypothetical protein
MAELARYLFNEAPVQGAVTAVDTVAGGSGSHSGSYFFTATPSDGSILPGGVGGSHVRISLADSGSVVTLGNIADLRLTGEMTVTFWYYTEGVDSWHPIIEVNGVDETQVENKLFAVSRESSGRLAMKWEHTAGVDVDVNSANNIVQNWYQWIHCAVVRVANGGNFDVLFYVNGALVDTQDNGGGGYQGPDGGGNSLAFIGRDQASAEPVGTFRMDSLGIYNSAESAGTILALYTAEEALRQASVIRDTDIGPAYETTGGPYDALLSGERNPRVDSGFVS